MELPTFTPCQTAANFEFYVLVAWPNGAEMRINHFTSLQDARRWIACESANWLGMRAQARPLRQSNEGENPGAPRAVRAQRLQVA